jgi:hypothetical protein
VDKKWKHWVVVIAKLEPHTRKGYRLECSARHYS